MPSSLPETIPVFILCGGLGTRLGELARDRPKPMVELDGEPILQHVMRSYARFGFRRFVLCTGHRDEAIVRHFLDFTALYEDFTVDLGTRAVAYHQSRPRPDWQVTIAHTGENTMTGARLARAAERYLGDAKNFAVTYGDGLSDVDLGAELIFHLAHQRLATVLAVNPVSPFGEFQDMGNGTSLFMEKPEMRDRWISGGFFFFRRAFLDRLSTDQGCILEQEPLRRVSEEGELALFHHDGFWSSIDTPGDHAQMSALCEHGTRPWLEGNEHAGR